MSQSSFYSSLSSWYFQEHKCYKKRDGHDRKNTVGKKKQKRLSQKQFTLPVTGYISFVLLLLLQYESFPHLHCLSHNLSEPTVK